MDCSQCQFSKVIKEKLESYVRGKGPKMGVFNRLKYIIINTIFIIVGNLKSLKRQLRKFPKRQEIK